MKKNHKLFLVLILGLGLFLRLFRLESLFHFTMDEALIAFRGWGLFELSRPFLIGGISPLQVHLPPYFYYLSSFILKLANYNPLGWGVWASLIGLATIISLYCLTKKLFNQITALVASLLYATSFTAVFFDRHYWPLSLNPLLTVLTFIFLTKLSKKSFWPYLGLFLTLSLALTADPSNIPLALTVLAFLVINRKSLSSRFTLSSLSVGLITFFTPLILFDLRHHWQNFSGIQKLFQTTQGLQFSLSKLIDALLLLPRSLVRFWHSPQTSLVKFYSYCIPYAQARQHQLALALVVLAIVIITWFLASRFRSHQKFFKAIKFLLIFYFLGITLFGSLGFSLFDHYLSGLLPIFSLITAMALTHSAIELIGPVILVGLIALNLFQFPNARHPYSLYQKQRLINWVQPQLKDQAFALDSISKCHKENGLRYLFALTDNPPVISFMDPNFSWLYREPPQPTLPDKILLITDKDLNLSQPIINKQTFGAMTAIILDNTAKTYEINY